MRARQNIQVARPVTAAIKQPVLVCTVSFSIKRDASPRGESKRVSPQKNMVGNKGSVVSSAIHPRFVRRERASKEAPTTPSSPAIEVIRSGVPSGRNELMIITMPIAPIERNATTLQKRRSVLRLGSMPLLIGGPPTVLRGSQREIFGSWPLQLAQF